MRTMPDLSFPTITESDFPNGIRCTECHRGIEPGQPYTEQLEAVHDAGEVVTSLVCVYCLQM